MELHYPAKSNRYWRSYLIPVPYPNGDIYVVKPDGTNLLNQTNFTTKYSHRGSEGLAPMSESTFSGWVL